MEEWRDITHYEGRYQVSNLGRVRSLARCFTFGAHERCLQEVVMQCNKNYNGYLYVFLKKDGLRKKSYVHRLVAAAFMPEYQNEIVNHINGDKQKNTTDNLEWSSHADNTKHYYSHRRAMEERNAAF